MRSQKRSLIFSSRVAVLGLFLVGAAWSTPSFARVGVTVLGGASFFNPTFKDSATIGTPSIESEMGIGGGALFDISGAGMFGLEVGGLYAPMKFKYAADLIDIANATVGADGTNETYTLTMNTFIFPVSVRIKPSKFLAINAGGYFQVFPGTYKVKVDLTSSSSESDVSNSDSKLGYGLQGGVQLHLPLAPMISFVVDGRYYLGLKDQDSSSTGEFKTKGFTALGGFRFGL